MLSFWAMTQADFFSKANEFTEETKALLDACFSNVDEPKPEKLEDRLVVRIRAHLHRNTGRRLAELDIYQRFCLDSSERYLAVEQSIFKVTAVIDRTPIVRYEYDRLARSKPSSHIQIHAHRGAISHLLSQNKHREPHALESLHFPTGGPRFRPALEDLLEFLICDCKFEPRDGWRKAIRQGRERWRRLQTRAVVRDAPSEAVQALEEIGYKIQLPDEGPKSDNLEKLQAW